jgi:hypothetical protein
MTMSCLVFRRRRTLATAAVVAVLGVGQMFAGNAKVDASGRRPATLPGTVFVTAPPPGATGPDDITRLATPGVDGGRALIWTAYQNGINPDGTPGTPGGPTRSTVAGYDPFNGRLVETIAVTGKVDGLTAYPSRDRLIATVNEDDNSALNLIDAVTRTVVIYHYSPDPAVSSVGGTDSIAIWNGRIVVAHSNPSDSTQPTEYAVTLDRSTHTAMLRPLFRDDSRAFDVLTHSPVTLGLTDPDTNAVMPRVTPRFGGQLATISQGDGEIVFTAADGRTHKRLSVLRLTDNVAGNIPPIDGIAVATEGRGALYVVDATAGTITKLDTSGWPVGTVFVGEPSDNGNPLVGALDLHTGVITPLNNAFVSPKGLLFVPA